MVKGNYITCLNLEVLLLLLLKEKNNVPIR